MALIFVALLSALVPVPSPAEQAPPEPPTPALFLSLGLSADALAANWREPNPIIDEGLQQIGATLRLAGGVRLGSRTALFIDSAGSIPLVVPAAGVEVGGVGLGIDQVLQLDGPWHLRASARRAWAYRSRVLEAPILQSPPAIRTIDKIWLFELGIGHANRAARLDRGWMLVVFGGPLWVETGMGWIGGLSLGRVWSRS